MTKLCIVELKLASGLKTKTKIHFLPDETSAVLLSQMMYNDYKTCISTTPSTPTPAEHLLVQWVYNVKW